MLLASLAECDAELVRLTAVPGVSGGVLCVLMSELGTAQHLRVKFRSAEAFASWLGLCPDNRASGGRILKAVSGQPYDEANAFDTTPVHQIEARPVTQEAIIHFPSYLSSNHDRRTN